MLSLVDKALGGAGRKKATSTKEVAKMLLAAQEKGYPVEMRLGNSPLRYFTYLDPDMNTEESLGAEEAVGIKAMDPPIGNIKIRNARKIVLQFYTDRELVRASVRFLEIVGNHLIFVSFPHDVERKPQKRAAIRVNVDAELELELDVIRPSGLRFQGIPTDISSGGMAFMCSEDIPNLAEKAKVKLAVHYPGRRATVVVSAVVIRKFNKDGHTGFCTRFLIDSYDVARSVDAVVAFVQREYLKKRSQMFS
ncbi:PilZ domain-containing protein [Magnetococcales bacterium HHB-1]